MGKNSKIEWTLIAQTPIGRQLDGRTWDEYPRPEGVPA